MAAVERLGARWLGFVRCRPAFMVQLNTVRNFACNGVLISFYAPYVCVDCELQFDILIDLRRDHEKVSAMDVPDMRCPTCGGAASFDDLPTQFGAYMTGTVTGRTVVRIR